MSSNLTTTKAGAVSADLVVSSFPTSLEVGHALRSGVRLVIDGKDEAAGIGRSLSALTATTIDDVFGAELTKAGEVLGTPLTLRSFEGLRSSDFDDSVLGVWAIFSATTPDGELVTIGTGATDAVVKLVRLSELDAFDGKTTVAFEESKKATASGYYPVNLVRVKTADGF